MEGLYKDVVISAIILILGGLVTLIIARLTKIVVGRFTRRTKSETDDYILNVLISTIKPIGWVISASIAWKVLPIQDEIDQIVLGISKLFLLVFIVRLINKIILRLMQRWALKIDDSAVSTMLQSLRPMVRALIWCVGFVFYLQNMGVQMAAIWALLSAGGIGAGLALKEPVQEFFEYITILLDKPFQNGQFIHIEGVWATVERVGVRSTRLRSLNGEIIVMSNSFLTNGVISNYAEMKHRRLVHRLGVVYETSIEKMKDIPILIKSIVEKTPDALFDRCHFVEFGSCSLDFELVYYVPTNDYVRAMEAQQEINIEIMRSFEKKAIEFAFPTQTIHIPQNLDSKE